MSNDLHVLLSALNESPETVEFDQVMAVITEYYHYTPTRFINGEGAEPAVNEAGTNEGSCKIFAFAKLQSLSEKQTLACFGKYYRDDVLLHPDANDHGNIRHFMKSGWGSVQFDVSPLAAK